MSSDQEDQTLEISTALYNTYYSKQCIDYILCCCKCVFRNERKKKDTERWKKLKGLVAKTCYETCDECVTNKDLFGVILDLILKYLFTSAYITKFLLLNSVYQETMTRISFGENADGIKYFFILFSLFNILYSSMK